MGERTDFQTQKNRGKNLGQRTLREGFEPPVEL